MKKSAPFLNLVFSTVLTAGIFFGWTSCKQETKLQEVSVNDSISHLFEKYFDERMELFPIEATQNGVNRYNDQLPCDISEVYRQKVKAFYERYLDDLIRYDRNKLSEQDRVSYDILKWELETDIESFRFNDHYIPFNQFWGLPLTMAQLGSGQGVQPFNTVKDYENFLGRMSGFAVWCDTAVNNMRKGVEKGYVLPKALAKRMVPQLQALVVKDIRNYIFYQPLKNMPDSFSTADKARLINLYETAINEKIIPSYTKLLDFIQDEYLDKCRNSNGISALPDGKEYYSWLVRYWTTTEMTPDEIFLLGEKEVARLRTEMEKVMKETGFHGDLKSFFMYLQRDPKFRPFRKPEEVLAAFHEIKIKMEPQLKKLFEKVPRSGFEIRQTEKFREASASAEYNQGSPDGSRPGIFYVPIPDASRYSLVGMESLFLHEAIPGHHYQISLQNENTGLPEFRRFLWYGAYGEGWALYSESLGKELGLYTDPYQYFGNLSEEMHRAIRLVVDVGLHVKEWTREQAIAFSLANEAESEEAITAEIERYMAIPGQALSYKIGQIKIISLSAKARMELGESWKPAAFHDKVLSEGCLPLRILESQVEEWIIRKKK